MQLEASQLSQLHTTSIVIESCHIIIGLHNRNHNYFLILFLLGYHGLITRIASFRVS